MESPRLFDLVRDAIRIQHYSLHTDRAVCSPARTSES